MKPLILALSLAASLSAATIPLFDTGTGASNSPLGPSSLETHFSIIPGGTGVGNAFLTRYQLPYFSEAGINGRWISPAVVQPGVAPSFPSENASYILEQTFDMTPFISSTASLSGFFAADNCSVIRLNSTVLATTGGTCSGSSPSSNFTTLTPFSATSSAFNSGINTLRIDYFNYGGPGALLVTGLEGTADPVPEPTVSALIGIGLVAIALRKKVA